MPNLSFEAIAVVDATYRDVEQRHAAITLRMWHHLPKSDGSEALFADFDTGDLPQTLLRAFLAAIPQRRRGRWPHLRSVTGFQSHQAAALEQSFGVALGEVLGASGGTIVVNAWREIFASFLAQLRTTRRA